MLMISRRVGDRIIIDGDVEVVITEIRRRTVRLGIRGGDGRMILRGEVHDAIQAANRSAAATSMNDGDLDALFEAAGAEPEGEESGGTEPEERS